MNDGTKSRNTGLMDFRSNKMRQVIVTSNLDWEDEEMLKRLLNLLNVDKLPQFIIVDGGEE